jgi:chromosome segregation ATPase
MKKHETGGVKVSKKTSMADKLTFLTDHAKKTDKRFDSNDVKLTFLTDHAKKTDKRFDSNDVKLTFLTDHAKKTDKRFDSVESRLDKHDRQIEKVIDKLTDHDIRLERIERTMVTKTEFHEAMNRMNNTMDFIAKGIKDSQEERFAMDHRVERLERRVDVLETK